MRGVSDDRIEKRLHELRELAKKYAKAQGDRVYLDHFHKSQLAILMKEYATQGYETAAAQEREARADKEYIACLEGLREATREAEQALWELRIADKGIDLFRTREATRRAEMKGYS